MRDFIPLIIYFPTKVNKKKLQARKLLGIHLACWQKLLGGALTRALLKHVYQSCLLKKNLEDISATVS